MYVNLQKVISHIHSGKQSFTEYFLYIADFFVLSSKHIFSVNTFKGFQNNCAYLSKLLHQQIRSVVYIFYNSFFPKKSKSLPGTKTAIVLLRMGSDVFGIYSLYMLWK